MLGSSDILSLFFVVIASISTTCGKQECDYQFVARSGIIENQNTEDKSCKWTVLPPDVGSRLLVRVLNAALSSNFDLIIYTDDNEYRIDRNCENCLENITSSSLKVLLQRLPGAEGINFRPSFRILYESFTPGTCIAPQQISNGFVIGKNYEVGKSVMFVCNSPYQIVGKSIVRCLQEEGSIIPFWSAKTPSCEIPKCSNGPIKLKATGRGSAIVNPGYELGAKVLPGQSCWWDIVAARQDQQIKAVFQYLDLSNDSTKLQLYDGSLDKLILELDFNSKSFPEMVTESNRLIVIYFSGSLSSSSASGFMMNYSSVGIKCPAIRIPPGGSISPKTKSYGLGDVVILTCDDGYRIYGGMGRIKCMISGQWSGHLGLCETKPVVTETLPRENTTVMFEQSETRTAIMDYDPFGLKAKSEMPASIPKEHETKWTTRHDSDQLQTKITPPFVWTEKTVPQQQWETVEPKPIAADFDVKLNISSEQIPFESEQPDPHKSNKTVSKPNLPTTTTTEFSISDDNASTSSSDIPHPFTAGSIEYDTEPTNVIDMEILFVVCGVSVPILVILTVILVFVLYRRRYPARMGFGKKFSTFENPMYERNGPQRGELLPTS